MPVSGMRDICARNSKKVENVNDAQGGHTPTLFPM